MTFYEQFKQLFSRSPVFAAATVWAGLSLLMLLRSIWH